MKIKKENKMEKEGKESKMEKQMEKKINVAEYKKGGAGKKTNYKGKCC
jgi:hypothetical protein